jgi:phosphoglycolate phosphatase
VRYRAVVFDFDGTLVDTREPILLGLKHALSARGWAAPPDAEILRHVGFGLHEVLQKLVAHATAEEIDGLAADYRVRFDEVAPGRTRLFDGMREVLDGLKGNGVRLAIATNRSRASLEPMLAEHGLDAVFDCWLSATCLPFPKPHPLMLERTLETLGVAPDAALMVGDTTVDLAMGRAARVDTCAVTYGAHTEEELRREGPTHVVRSAPEIAGVWR